MAGGNHAAVHLEHQVIRWFTGLLGWPGGYSGQLVSGGSAATLTALAVARHRAAGRSGLSVVCFRHRPAGMDLARLDSAGLDSAGLDSAGLDRHNQAVLKAVRLGGRAFLAGTTVDGVFALRACIVNPGLTTARVAVLLGDIRDRAAGLISAR